LYVINDPYAGGTHLPDIAIASPIFHQGRVIGYVATMSHHADVGGSAPGSVSAVGVYDHFAEGLRIPMIRIGVGGAMLEDVLSLITANSRTPFNMRADLRAQSAACGVGLERLQLLFEEKGAPQVEAGMDWLLDYADRLTRQEIESIPDGRYTFTDYLDDDGSGPEAKPVPICVAMTVNGSTLHFDFTGTGAQVRTAINNVPYSVISVVYFLVRTLVSETAPNNDGCYRGVTVHIPEGTILNPRFPAPVAARGASLRRVIDALYGVMALAIPEKMTGANCGQSSLIQIGTHDDAGKFSVGVLGGPFMGGMGARADKDGIDCTDHDCSNAFNMPIEVCEAALPILFHRLELWTDSGGAGRSRGGLGYHLDAEWQRGEGMASLKRERQKFAPWGICGGQSAPLCRTMLSSAGQPPQPLTPKSQTTLHPGDRLLLWTTGSGGYGEPERRDAQRVLDDVLDGRVSEAAALHDYKVVIHSGAVDADATAARRDCLTGSTA
jgi:N-methylhydantoinase B